MTKINGEIRHTFTGVERSPSVFATRATKTMTLKGTDAFTVAGEISYDDGVTWTPIEEFTGTAVKNFEWFGRSALISFNCTVHTSDDVELIFA